MSNDDREATTLYLWLAETAIDRDGDGRTVITKQRETTDESGVVLMLPL